MRILVTGGAGYVGSACAAHFLTAGHQVTVYDSLVKGHRAAVPDGVAFIKGDIGDLGALDILFQTHDFDAVAHFAAFIEAGESMKLPGKYFHNNVANTQRLLEAVTRYEVKQFIFSSSAGVYASKNAALNEDDPVGPASVYGETKLMIERMLHWYNCVTGLQFAALRYFNACGAMLDATGNPLRGEDHHPETHVIPLALQVPLGKRDAFYVFGTDYHTPDGTCIRDYVHIEDLASAHVLALEALDDEHDHLVYNLGTGRGYSVREVAEVAKDVTGVDFPVVETHRRPGDADMLVASSERINDELGWTPRFPDLRDIVSSAWKWHSSRPDGFGDAID
ncbi:MAG TPA: UDP-glucose 4-epimerase GalE [Aggregatilineaceae bacterium]|nr:UDP-glucose 4-epimerase GalE [Aggregatilineaceae bacterium]